MDVKLYVGNLAFTTTEDDLRVLFSQAGAIHSIDLIKDRDTGESKGFAFVTMATQSDAVLRLQESTYDVLVVDIELAEGNGVAVIRQARQLYPPDAQPLIVVLTNYASDFVRDHCFAAGADYFLDKMRDIALLKAVVVDGRSKWAPPVASH